MAQQTQSGYEVTCSGQFYATQDRSKVLRTFSGEVFFLPETMTIKTGFKYVEMQLGSGDKTHKIKRAVPKMEKVNSLAWSQHIIQRYMLPARLAAKYKDFSRFRTCVITSTKRVNRAVSAADDLSEENIPVMTLEQLHTLCTIKAMQVPLDDFADIVEARRAVMDELQNIKLAEAKNKVQPEEAAEEISTPEPAEKAETEDLKGGGSITTAPVTDDDLLS